MIIGYPCKSVSSQNGSAASFKDTKSKTGAGFKALKDYVRYARPRVVVAENVATMCHKRSKFGGEIPIDVQNKAFAAMATHITTSSFLRGISGCARVERVAGQSTFLRTRSVLTSSSLEQDSLDLSAEDSSPAA